MVYGSQIAVPLHCKSGGSYLREHSSSITEISDFRHEPERVALLSPLYPINCITFCDRNNGLKLIQFTSFGKYR